MSFFPPLNPKVLYHGFALYDPWLLFPREHFPKDARTAAAVITSITRYPSITRPVRVYITLIGYTSSLPLLLPPQPAPYVNPSCRI